MPSRVHLKVDTGMGRIGFLTPEETKQAVRSVQSHKEFLWEGIFTHFSIADEIDTSYFEKQTKRFKAVLAALEELPRYVHVSNSATALWYPDAPGNMIRYGVATHGLNPSDNGPASSYASKPALRLISELIHVKRLAVGEGIGYGETYVTEAGGWTGIVPIDYVDGWLRHPRGFTVLVNGKRCETVGRVCMNQCMVRLAEEIPAGSVVTLVGKNDNEENTLQMIAEKSETIHYEVACTPSQRTPGEYN